MSGPDRQEDGITHVNGMTLLQLLAGVFVETYLVFDEPDQAMMGSFRQMEAALGGAPMAGDVCPQALPPAHIMDYQVERGKHAARLFFEEWMDCTHEFHTMLISLMQHVFISWEDLGWDRAETLRLFQSTIRSGLAFEISAQELCDISIEEHVATMGWTLGDCISALSAVAGRKLAQSLGLNTCMIFKGCDIPDNLDRIVYVMTKEAVRLGVPAGTDWRFGLAANDMPINAPTELIRGMEPYCDKFFAAINMACPFEQSVACAKAAGRMVAVASGGELPEIEPAIAKPLAMSAMTESYKFVCMDHQIASL